LTLSHQFPSQLLDQGDNGRQVYNSVMANAQNKVAFRTEHDEDLTTLARGLFRGAFDPNEIKHPMYSTKVMGYREEMRTAYQHSRTVTASSGEGDIRSEGAAETENKSGEQQSFNAYY